jgi:beta-glucosidase
MGGEFRKKGVQVALGPVVGPLGRTTTGGRNWEGECRKVERESQYLRC